ncbi:GGDEF domain-containing protein [Lottiidibacillus patelloidae]|uniref:GGDEF domain-containing protein n=1 Tax=Lottiidibacillus patelloidae TaxID=2670334 RepID=A0A263BSK5_9BACI|nr:EAL domain-containing protein [Lottiidibacillus patelloidae]OZM56685.1 GGDEF domain-containing protein [Lottiidibacillus patelloidae]
MEFYSLTEFMISIVLGGIAAFGGMFLIKKLPSLKAEGLMIHWSSLLISGIICLMYLYGGFWGSPSNIDYMVGILFFIFTAIAINITVNTIRLHEVSFFRLIIGAFIFAACITIVNMVDFLQQLINNKLQINFLLFSSGVILAFGNSVASIRFIRQIRSVALVNFYWLFFGSVAIGMAFASLRYTLFSSVTFLSDVHLFTNTYMTFIENWAYIDNTLLPLTINILGLVILELVPGFFGDKHNKQQAEIIVENKQRYKSLFDNGAVAIFSLDVDGNVHAANGTALNIAKYKKEEITSIGPFLRLIFPADRNKFKESFEQAVQGNSTYSETKLLAKTSEIVDMQMTIVPTFVKGKVTNITILMKDISETIQAREQIHYLAYHDPLTNLPNRRHFTDKVKQYVNDEREFALIFLDVDRFKVINDVLGHAMGDELLLVLAERLSDIVGENGLVARMGGDEFTILLPSDFAVQDVEILVQTMVDVINTPFHIKDQELYVTGSIGIAMYPEDGRNHIELMKHADTAMYRAKEKGKNTYEFYYNHSDSKAGDRLALEKDMRKSIINNDFELYYQPQVNTHTGKVTSVEALIRWNHPEKGVIAPSHFIPIAEETGIIHELGEWVVRQACKQVRKWQVDGFAELQLSVNISIKQFYNKNFVSVIKDILEETKFDPKNLDIEITETMAMKDVDHAIHIFEQLKALGISISLDDFGKGYSSLNHIKDLPINRLKIDGSFIQDVPTNQEAIIIIKTIIAMARTLNITSMAEHVENEDQLNFLKQLNCDEMQGYYFTPPMPANKAKKWFEEHSYLHEKIPFSS